MTKKIAKKKTVKKATEVVQPIKQETKMKPANKTCKECKHSQFPEGEKVKRGMCRRYPTHTPIMLKSFCGEFA